MFYELCKLTIFVYASARTTGVVTTSTTVPSTGTPGTTTMVTHSETSTVGTTGMTKVTQGEILLIALLTC